MSTKLKRLVEHAQAQHFASDQIIKELEREITMRHRVYGRKVDEGTMNPITAARRIAILHAARDRIEAATLEDQVRQSSLFDAMTQ